MANDSNNVADEVRAFIEENGLLDGVDRLRVGFSGGADSTLLTVLMKRFHDRIEAVHFHHGLRGADADADAEWCERFCRARGIAFICVRLQVPDRKVDNEGIEEAARRLRLEYWRDTTAEQDAVALAHHADDCMEDLLLRLTRGANAGGLTALRPERIIHGVRMIRPLLCLRRSDIEAFLLELGISDWRHDTTNRDTAIRRNAVRHRWLPLIRETVGHDQGLLRSLEALREDADCLEELAERSVRSVESAEALNALHPALLPRVLRLWLYQELGEDTILPRETILRLREELARFEGAPVLIPLGGDVMARLDDAGLRLVVEKPPLSTRSWNWREANRLDLPEIDAFLMAEPVDNMDLAIMAPHPDSEVFAERELVDVLEVRAWKHGDRLVPFSRHTPVKLQDLFTDAKVPREERRRIPLVVSGNTIAWVPGVRRAELGRALEGDRAVRIRVVRDAANR